MNKYWKIVVYLVVGLLFISTTRLSAQVSCDPGDRFYAFAQGWELRGIVDRVPNIRPYPLPVIKNIIEQVLEKGTPADKETAAFLSKEIFGKQWSVLLESVDTVKTTYDVDGVKNQITFNPYVQGDLSVFDDFISGGYKIGWYNTTDDSSTFVPLYQNFMHDSIQDAASIGPFKSYVDMNTCFAVGTKDLYVQAGVYRTGYGPYLNEGLSLNDSAYHAPHLTIHLNREKWSFTEQFSSWGATTNSNCEGSFYSGKFVSLHSFDFYLLPTMTFSFYETAVFGRRMELSYLFPAPFMVIQGISGCNDNLQMGIVFSYKPVKSLAWDTDVLVDDISVNDIVKLNFDTKIRTAVKTGIVYAPDNSICTRMALNFTAITPYMYSHWEYENPTQSASMTKNTVNYQNYTNCGYCMGSSYPPNSDRISYTIDFDPIERLHVQITSAFMRHANICENLTDEEAAVYLVADPGVYSTDGSVFTHTMFADSTSTAGDLVDTAWNHLHFLNQDSKMYIVQAGMNAEYHFAHLKWCDIGIKTSYLFEFIANKGVDTDIYEGMGHTVNADGIFVWNGVTYTTESDMLAAAASYAATARAAWRAQFQNLFNNYFSLGVVIKY